MPTIKAIVVDDSVVIRKLLSRILDSDSEIEVVATAANGLLGLCEIAKFKPDVVVLDVEMPVMNGLETLRELRKTDRDTTIIMFSAHTARGADATFDALNAGADDYEMKPSTLDNSPESRLAVNSGLVRKIKLILSAKNKVRQMTQLGPSPFGNPMKKTATIDSLPTIDNLPNFSASRPLKRTLKTKKAKPVRTSPPQTWSHGLSHEVEIVVIGVSTGGPEALRSVIPQIPANFPVPILIVQHMPAIFTERMAKRLDSLSPLTVREASDSAIVKPGVVWIAAGDYHMEILRREGQVVLRTHQGPKENFCRPSVDVLFRSAAREFGSHVLATVMTGMGEDGLIGCQCIADNGGQIITQDQASSVVWGMPGAVTKAGLSDAVLPLNSIQSEILKRASAGRPNSLSTKVS